MQHIKFFNQNETHSCINLIILRNDNIICIILVNKTRCLNLIKKKNPKVLHPTYFFLKKEKKDTLLRFYPSTKIYLYESW